MREIQTQMPVSRSQQEMDRADLIVIGNGIGGLTTAIETRKRVPNMNIVLVTDQGYPTINTPALKQYAAGRLTPDELPAYPPGTERSYDIHVVREHVERIDTAAQAIGLSEDRWFGYKHLVIATGSAPNGLPDYTPNAQLDGVLTLHRLEDYRDLRRRLPAVRHAVVVGGGVHAAETVIALRKWHIQVHWLIRGEHFLSKQLDQEASNLILNHIREQNVIIQTQTEISGIIGRLSSVAAVLTNHQQLISCQLVCVCTGTSANMSLVRQCTGELMTTSGIVVDDHLKTTIPHLFAVGDVAALYNPQTGKAEPRAQWYAAVLQARIAATVIAGREEHIALFGVPWHATQLGKLSLLTIGDPLAQTGEELVNLKNGTYRRLVLRDGRLIGYLSLGHAQPDGLALKHIIDEKISIERIKGELLRPDFDARAYLATSKSQQATISSSSTQQIQLRRKSTPLSAPLSRTA